jgi:hypothetical protein
MACEVTDKIDRLLHDAQHALSGHQFAAMIGHRGPAAELKAKYLRLKAEAEALFLQHPEARWPHPLDAGEEFPEPKREK